MGSGRHHHSTFQRGFSVAALEMGCSSNELYLNSSSSKGLVFLWTSRFLIGRTSTCRIHNSVCRTLVSLQHKANNLGSADFSVDNCRVVRVLSTGFSTNPCASWAGSAGTKKPCRRSCDRVWGRGRCNRRCLRTCWSRFRKQLLALVPRAGTCPCRRRSPCGSCSGGVDRIGRPACAGFVHQRFFAVLASAWHRRF